MWVLEASGEILRGKRMWLRPGKQYLFGRVKKDGVRFAIDHKTVSRKHFIIEVSEVADGEVSQIHSRTKVTIIDQGSKSGTRVNGEELKGSDYRARELKHAKNSVRPGSLDQELLITWIPCVITYQLLKKDLKAGALKSRQERLKHLGVKVLSDFIPEFSTHVVANKRNTTKGLQALIDGKWLVTESFIEALELQATPSTLSQEENPSQLELDFDSAWPQEKAHLPAPGKEPTLRPAETYYPGPDRTHLFEHCTFIFLEQAQYDNLLPVITTGHGKTQVFDYVDGQTSAEEALDFIAKATGQKSFRAPSFQSSSGLVMVRWNKKPEEFTTAQANFVNQIALKINQRFIDQSELLDAILANDVSLLRQPIPQESLTEGLRAPPPSFAASLAPQPRATQAVTGENTANGTQSQCNSARGTQSQPPARQTQSSSTSRQATHHERATQDDAACPQATGNGSSQAGPPEDGRNAKPPKKPRYHPPTQVKFDDDFDPDDVAPYDDDDDDVDELEAAEPSQVEDSEPEAVPAPTPKAQAQSRKRRRSPSPVRAEVPGAGMDDLLPAVNAMKKQRREFEEDLRRQGEPLQKSTTITAAPKPPRKELDVRDAVKRQREREKQQKQHAGPDDSEEEAVPPPDPDDKAPADLAIVEHMEMPIRHRPARARGANPEDDSRWDPRWNGLKNFKKFRPQEKGAVRRPDHASKIIVQLVPMATKKSGIGEEYWDKTAEERERQKKEKRRKEKRRAQESLSQNQGARTDPFLVDSDVSDDDGFRRGGGRSQGRRSQANNDQGEAETGASRTSPETARLQEEAAALLDHDVDMESPRRTRGDDVRTQTQSTTQRSTRPSSSASTARGTKRPATSSASTTASKKRQKTLPVREEDSGDDSDDMQFRVGKGKGRKGRT